MITTGLAPEIPEDLYFLIKKVRNATFRSSLSHSRHSLIFVSRLSPSASTSSATEKTRIASSVSFSSNPESTVSADTTRLLVSCRLHGDTRVLPLPLSSLREKVEKIMLQDRLHICRRFNTPRSPLANVGVEALEVSKANGAVQRRAGRSIHDLP